ncbi:MAG: S9 family peptidase [Armatimonadota bacterium]|nr:S9 family peptidase [Armatimonadota bacterium]
MSLDSVPLIPREEIFGNPEKANPRLSPDGTRLAYLAPDEGVLNIWLRTVGEEDDRPITRERERAIHVFSWAYDERHILYVQDRDGDENYHLYAVDLETDVICDLTQYEDIQARILAMDHRFPTEIFVGLNNRDVRLHDLYRLNLSTGEMALEIENREGVIDWSVDPEFQVRGACIQTSDGGIELRVRDTTESEWRSLVTWGPDEQYGAFGWTQDGRGMYLMDSRGTNTAELRLIDTATGELKTLASNPEVDLGGVFIRKIDRRVQAVGFNKHRLEWTSLDPDVAEDFAFLERAQAGQFTIASRDVADRMWLILYDQDVRPPAYYLYDRETKKLDYVFSTRPHLEEYELAEMRPVTIRSRDGLTLYCYLTLPPNVEPRGLPMVLNVHGGPWWRDSWGFMHEPQWLANRGYACLQVNFRGSTGFGKHFVNASNREWGGRMHDDLMDAVEWAIAEGIADPKRVAIYGGSYGGYAALVGAAFTPKVFACAVDLVGVSNLRTFLSSIPPYWEVMRKMLNVRVGDLEKDGEFLDSRSPLYKADQIECPLLIAQGANDPRVKQAESEQIVATLREKGKQVEYLLFEDEGHGFVKPQNRLKFYAAAEKFLAEHLGGRYLPPRG